MTLLGLRLALSANRVRLVVTAIAVSFTVAFLLGAMGALPARQAKIERLDARNPIAVGSSYAEGHAAPSGIVYDQGLNTYYRGKPMTIRLVDAGPGAPLPPGITSYPQAGEVVASPELARVLRGPHGSELASRVPGHVVGTVAEAGLAGPHELFAYVGQSTHASSAQVVSYYGHHYPKTPAPLELRLAAWLGALGLLLPVLVLVATATRLSAASRDRRMSAFRLVGATPKQARALGATEGLVAGVLGVLGGIVVFWLLRGPACALLPFPEGVYAQDLSPGVTGFVAVVLGVPVLAVVTGVLSLRRVVTSPLGVRRTAKARGAQWWRLVPVCTGLVMLEVLRLNQHDWPPGTPPGTTLLLGGGGLALVGLAVAASTFSRVGAWLLGRCNGISSSLASRRVEADPGGSARVVTGMVLVVFVAGWLLAFLPVLKGSRSFDADLLKAVPAGTLTTGSDLAGRSQVDLAKIRAIKGVRLVVQVSYANLSASPSSNPEDEHQIAVASCPALAKLTGHDLGCGRSKIFSLAEPSGSPLPRAAVTVRRSEDDQPVGTLVLPKDIPALPLATVLALAGLVNGDFLVDPSLLPAKAQSGFAANYVITTDGQASSVEAARAALPTNLALTAETFEEQASTAGSVYLGYLRAVRIGMVLALIVGAASLAVTTADAVNERRRSLAALVAIGTPSKVLRRTVLLQMAAPMLTNVLAALGAAAVASYCYLGLYDRANATHLGLPWGGWALTALAAAGAVLLATGATLPMLRAISRPEALRAE